MMPSVRQRHAGDDDRRDPAAARARVSCGAQPVVDRRGRSGRAGPPARPSRPCRSGCRAAPATGWQRTSHQRYRIGPRVSGVPGSECGICGGTRSRYRSAPTPHRPDKRKVRLTFLSEGRGRIAFVLVAVVADERGGGALRPLDAAGRPTGPAEVVADLAAAVAAREAAEHPRWVWSTATAVYPAAAARRRPGRPLPRRRADRGAAARARRPLGRAPLAGRRLGPADRRAGAGRPAAARRRAARARPGRAVRRPLPGPPGAGHRRADRRCTPTSSPASPRTEHPGRFRLLVAAESAGALIAAEMGARRAALAGRRARRDPASSCSASASPVGGPPRRLAELADQIAEAFGVRRLHPDSPAELLKAFARAGIDAAQHPGLGAARGGPSGGAAAAGVQGALPDLDGARLVLARAVGAGRPVPAGVRAGRRGLRPVGHPGRRRAADPEGGPAGGGGRSGLAVGGRRRRPVGAAGAGRGLRRRPAGGGGRRPATSTPRWPPTRSAATGPRPRWPCSARCTGRPAARRCPRWRCCRRSYPTAFGVRRGGGAHRRGGRAGALLAGPDLPARLGRVRRSRRRAVRSGRGGRPAQPAGPGRAVPGPVHPQLRHPGHRRRVGLHAAGHAAHGVVRQPTPSWSSSSTTR